MTKNKNDRSTIIDEINSLRAELQEKIKECILELSTNPTPERRMQLELHLDRMELALNNTDRMMAETRSRHDNQ